MLRLLRFLWTGSWHEHKWKVIKETKVYNMTVSKELPDHLLYTQECEICGILQTKKVG